MPLTKELIVSDDSHTNEYICPVCLSLPLLNEAVISTKECQHVFCSTCLGHWKQRSDKCPTCNREMLYADNLILKTYAPLAYRVLGRIKIKCSIADCSWIGDVSSLDAHILNSDNHSQKEDKTAVGLKEMGNERFSRGQYADALNFYTKALHAATDDNLRGILHANQAAVYLRMKKPLLAIQSCEESLKCGNSDPKLYIRYWTALCSIGQYEEATSLLSERAPNSVKIVTHQQLRKSQKFAFSWNEGTIHLKNNEFEKAKSCNADLISDEITNKNPSVISRAALIESQIGDVDTALRLSLEAVRLVPDHVDAWIARGQALLSNGQFDEARKAAKQALRLHPDSENAKISMRNVMLVDQCVTQARDKVEKHHWEEAKALLTDLIVGNTLPKASPLRIDLIAERANASFRCAKDQQDEHIAKLLYEDALSDASRVVYMKEDSVRGWLTRLYCLRELGRHEEAVTDARNLMNSWGSADAQIKSACERAEFELKKSKRPDLYAVLEVKSIASEMEIKAAYKRLALQYHPDKIKADAPEEEKKQYEEKFKLMGIALDVLGNHEKRELWDKGYDVNGIQEELQRRNYRHR